MEITKALSIKQPWGSLICKPRHDNPKLGIKDIENRTWKTHFRGRIYVHVSAKIVDVDFTSEQIADLHINDILISGAGYQTDMRVISAIIGEVEIVDCVINHDSIWAEKTEGVTDSNTKEFIPSNKSKPIWNWVLANPVLYDKPILNVKGNLSFWVPDTDIVKCIGCDHKFDSTTMEECEGGEKFCQECWGDLLPTMIQDAKDNEMI